MLRITAVLSFVLTLSFLTHSAQASFSPEGPRELDLDVSINLDSVGCTYLFGASLQAPEVERLRSCKPGNPYAVPTTGGRYCPAVDLLREAAKNGGRLKARMSLERRERKLRNTRCWTEVPGYEVCEDQGGHIREISERMSLKILATGATFTNDCAISSEVRPEPLPEPLPKL